MLEFGEAVLLASSPFKRYSHVALLPTSARSLKGFSVSICCDILSQNYMYCCYLGVSCNTLHYMSLTCLGSIFVILPVFIEDVLGYSAEDSGFIMAVAAVGGVISAPITGKCDHRCVSDHLFVHLFLSWIAA